MFVCTTCDAYGNLEELDPPWPGPWGTGQPKFEDVLVPGVHSLATSTSHET